jgi:hypothetical protein
MPVIFKAFAQIVPVTDKESLIVVLPSIVVVPVTDKLSFIVVVPLIVAVSVMLNALAYVVPVTDR